MQGAPITKIEPKIAARLAKQRYHLVGDHGGVKVCHWTKQSLIADRSCYKGTFYGIESHGCMQMAPNVDTSYSCHSIFLLIGLKDGRII